MKADYVHKDTLTATDYVELNKNNELLMSYNQALLKEKQELKKQLEYIRSGEYYNQLRFERDMLQDLVDKKEISKEDKEFIDMTRRNTELLEQQKEFIEYLEDKLCIADKVLDEPEEDEEVRGYVLARKFMLEEILSKYKEIIGDDK